MAQAVVLVNGMVGGFQSAGESVEGWCIEKKRTQSWPLVRFLSLNPIQLTEISLAQRKANVSGYARAGGKK